MPESTYIFDKAGQIRVAKAVLAVENQPLNVKGVPVKRTVGGPGSSGVVPILITGHTGCGGGYYLGLTITKPTGTIDPTVNLTLGAAGSTAYSGPSGGPANICFCMNYAEEGLGTNSLVVDGSITPRVVLGYYMGLTQAIGGVQYPVYLIVSGVIQGASCVADGTGDTE